MEYQAIYTDTEGKKYGCDREELGQIGDGMYYLFKSGIKIWFKDGKPHNEEGPAFIAPNGIGGLTEEWWLNGEKLSKEEWDRKLEPARLKGEGWDPSDIDLMGDLGMFEGNIVSFNEFKLNKIF